MKILIVYEEIPEDTWLYSVEVTPMEWEWIKLTHMKFVNAEMSTKYKDACNQLSVWLEGKKKLEASEPVLVRSENYDYVLVTGFLM